METRKLYYEDCHLTEFTACVTGCRETPAGYEVTLDATAFYPEGGGQACDLGQLGDAQVLDVQERGEDVIHLCDKPLSVGQQAAGKIDWERRFDLMQQHTGEHIVSGIVHKYFGYHNVGFHVGAEGMEVDFDGPISQEWLARIELEANQAVWANMPIQCWYPDEETLPHVSYRTKRALPWPVRIVEIGTVDACACCGIHTAFTGEVGLIKILSCVKFHQGVRMVMLCGQRAMDYLNRVYDQSRQVSQAFSARVLEIGDAARKMNEQLAAEKYRTAAVEKQLYAAIARSYAGKGNILHFEDALPPAGVRSLAEAISHASGGIAAVLSGADGRWDVCLACPGGDVKELGAAMADALGGRGGGKAGFFQGKLTAAKDEILDFFRNRGDF